MAWNKLETNTLSSSGVDIDLGASTAMSKNKFTQYMIHWLDDGTGSNQDSANAYTFNNDSGSNYANRARDDGGTEYTFTNQDKMYGSVSVVRDDGFTVVYICAIDGEEILWQNWTIDAKSSGAGTAPRRSESVNKYTGTSQFTRLDAKQNRPTGYNFDVDSNASAIGSDGTESLNIQDGAIYYDTDLNKEYVLYNNTWTEV